MIKNIFFIFAQYSGLNFLCEHFYNKKVFIVGYHSVFSEINRNILKNSEYPHISIDAYLFEKQIKFMVDHGHTFIKFKNIPDIIKLKIKKPTIVYFDDGFKDNILNALPVLKKYNIPATFFIAPKYVDSGSASYMDWEDIRELQKERMEIGSHTYSHFVLTNVGPETLKEELISSKERIEKEIKSPIEIFSYPKGRLNNNVVKAVKEAGYKYAVTTKYGVNSFDYVFKNPFLLKKVAPRVYESLSDFKVRLYSFNLFR